MIQINPLGVFLSVLFVSSMVILFTWMFRVPPAVPLPVVKVHGSVEALHRILVPLIEAMSSERAVELACRLGNGKKVELVLVHIVVIPYTLPLNAPMPEGEKAAQEALELGQVIASRFGCKVETRIVRHRNAVEGVLRVAVEERVDAIVLGVGLKSRRPGEWGHTSAEILRLAPCEVIVDKVPIFAHPMPRPA